MAWSIQCDDTVIKILWESNQNVIIILQHFVYNFMTLGFVWWHRGDNLWKCDDT